MISVYWRYAIMGLKETLEAAKRETDSWPKWESEGVESIQVDLVQKSKELLEQIDILVQTLRFYADPRKYGNYIDDEDANRSVPDFYDEMEFGSAARDTLIYVGEWA